MFLVAAAMVSSAGSSPWPQLPDQVVSLLQAASWAAPMLLMMAIMLLVMVVGTAMDMTPTILILTPVLMPLVKAAGIDPVYFGVLFIINNSIGLVTPPVGTVLNVVAGVGRYAHGRRDARRDALHGGRSSSVMFLMVLFPSLVMVPAKLFHG
jgi:TRAP-type C4-dicarboxylate transport system permease large subunit